MKINNKKIRLGYHLFPWQQDIIAGILNNPHDIHIVKSKRQTGKSITIETILMYYAINKMNSCSIALSPTLGQGRKLFKEIKRAIQKLPIYEGSNSTTLEINFTNGSSIKFKSGEMGDALRGETVSGILCIDEAVFIKDDVIFSTFPFVDAHRAPILMSSTPKFKSGCFWDFYNKAKNGEKGFHLYDINYYDTSALLSKERLEMYRNSLAPLVFASEYLGNFIEALSDLFGDVEKLCGTAIHTSKGRVLGIDWSNGAMDKNNEPDETALAILNENKELERIEAFADKEVMETIDYIIQIIRNYNIQKCVVETNSMGATYVNLLKRKISELQLRCQVIEFATTNQSKRDIIEALQVECMNKTIQLLNDPKLLLEMVGFQASKTPSGLVTYGGSPGVHDDLVMALAFALYGLRQGRYNVR